MCIVSRGRVCQLLTDDIVQCYLTYDMILHHAVIDLKLAFMRAGFCQLLVTPYCACPYLDLWESVIDCKLNCWISGCVP